MLDVKISCPRHACTSTYRFLCIWHAVRTHWPASSLALWAQVHFILFVGRPLSFSFSTQFLLTLLCAHYFSFVFIQTLVILLETWASFFNLPSRSLQVSSFPPRIYTYWSFSYGYLVRFFNSRSTSIVKIITLPCTSVAVQWLKTQGSRL